MFGFSPKNNAPAYGALIDIGSGTIGVAIVASNPDDTLPHLLYTHRSTMRITEHAGDAENLRRIREILLSACLLLSQEGYQALYAHDPKARVTKLFVTCSSPWSYTVARNVHYESDELFKVTQNLIKDLVESAETEIATHIRETSALQNGNFEIVESATVDMTVNDYPVHNPIRLQGVSLGLSHVAGLIPTEIMTALREAEEKLFSNTQFRAHTYMLVMYCVMRDLFPRVKSLVIIDVTGEATEFGIVESNLLIENTYVPMGSTTFVRNIMKATKKPAEDIISSIASYDNESKNIPPELKAQSEEYISSIISTIDQILGRRLLPQEIIITAHRPYERLFNRLITTALKKVTGSDVTVIAIAPEIVNSVTDAHAEADVYLALSARFFHKLHGCGEQNEN